MNNTARAFLVIFSLVGMIGAFSQTMIGAAAATGIIAAWVIIIENLYKERSQLYDLITMFLTDSEKSLSEMDFSD